MKKIINSESAPKAVGPYSQATQANGFIFISGQLPINPADGKMPESVEEQTEQCLKNVQAILKEAGCDLGHVLKSTVLLANMDDFATMNAVYAKFYTTDMPARVCYQVARLPMGAKVEIETIAVK